MAGSGPVRILLVGGGVHPIPPTGYGAVERILWELAGALRAQGEEVTIVNRVRHRRMRDEYPFAWELPRLLRSERYDVVHANTPVVANRLALGGSRFVYTSHSRHWFYRDRLSHRWGYWLERRAVRRATEVVALTETLARAMRSEVRPPRPPISVVPFGVDAARFRPDPSRRTGTRALGVGVVAPFKRWELAARALRGTGLTLRIAGPISSEAYARTVRESGDSVDLLGEVGEPDLLSLYAESDLLVHPSGVEVLSAAVLQGLAAGLPVLGGPAVADAVVDGTSGFVVPDPNPGGFVEGIRRRATGLARDTGARERMSVAARTSAVERFGWDRIAAAHREIYRRVVGAGAAA